MVAAVTGIGFLSFGVWAHHMFSVGMTSHANTFFALITMAVGIPTGIKIFNWLGTLWGGKIRFATPMLFCLAFLFQLLIAGQASCSGAPSTGSLTYFVVAHFPRAGRSHRFAIRGLLLLRRPTDAFGGWGAGTSGSRSAST
jgi:cytochrome c oxidase subunit 1